MPTSSILSDITKHQFNPLLQNVFHYLQKELWRILSLKFGQDFDFNCISIDLPKNKSHGDFYTNAAMMLSKSFNISPQELAQYIKTSLSQNQYIHKIDIAGPGFINITVTNEFWNEFINAVFSAPEKYGKTSFDQNKKILIEFVSANPTGPMHVGHCRGAIFGDALANLLTANGYNVTREYYINDAGTQIRVLAQSLFVRYQQLCGIEISLNNEMYPGKYLKTIAQDLKNEHGESLIFKSFEEAFTLLREFCISKIMDLIKYDLKSLGVIYDSFISELYDLQEKGYVEKAFNKLVDNQLIYTGTLTPPKGIKSENWQAVEQQIFASTNFGDDLDRAVKRGDGSYTYFAGDLGLALHRIERGYNHIILIVGVDHIGFIKRLKAAVKALGHDRVKIDLPVTQMVNLIKNGQPFKMSKRSGNFVQAQDVVDEVGIDVLRFILLSRKNDTIIDFDFEKVSEQTKENPVFYVQYAHARCKSILMNALNEFNFRPNLKNISMLTTTSDKSIIKLISSLPKVIGQAASSMEPHRVINFLIELATEFHSYWSLGSSETTLRFIIPTDQELTEARLVLVDLVRLTITITLNILGIKAMDKM